MRGMYGAQRQPAAIQIRRFAQSPTDALIDLKVRCRLRRQIPVRLDLRPVTHLRITLIPQWWPARRGYVWWLGVDPDVIEDLSDSCVPSAMNAIRRICPPHSGHSKGNTS